MAQNLPFFLARSWASFRSDAFIFIVLFLFPACGSSTASEILGGQSILRDVLQREGNHQTPRTVSAPDRY